MAEALPLNFSKLSQTIDDILETLPQVTFIKNIVLNKKEKKHVHLYVKLKVVMLQ